MIKPYRVTVLICAIALFPCAYVAWSLSQPTETPRPFDADRWAQSLQLDTTADPGCFRGGMALDLIQQRTLLGKREPDVVALLGSPSVVSSTMWLYPVGQCGFLWGHHALHLTFDTDGFVAEAKLADAT